jgi:ABC-type lipoprotein export system ATPase subunit
MVAELINITKYYLLPGKYPRKQLPGLHPPVLDDISLFIDANDSLAIMGPSGSGKSTLLNILGTLDKPTSGEVIIDGQNIGLLADDVLAGIRNSFIGFVFQMHHLLPQITLLENALLPVLPQRNKPAMQMARERAFELLARVGLRDHAGKYPYQLSAGECQRAAVVRALINQPKLLLADEPTGSLDEENAARLGELLSILTVEQQVSVVVVTHSPELAARMGKTYRLGGGKLKLVS